MAKVTTSRCVSVVCSVSCVFLTPKQTPTQTQDLQNLYEKVLESATLRELEAAVSARSVDPVEILAAAVRAAAEKNRFDAFEHARSELARKARQYRDEREHRRAAQVLAEIKRVPTWPESPFYPPAFLVRCKQCPTHSTLVVFCQAAPPVRLTGRFWGQLRCLLQRVMNLRSGHSRKKVMPASAMQGY